MSKKKNGFWESLRANYDEMRIVFVFEHLQEQGFDLDQILQSNNVSDRIPLLKAFKEFEKQKPWSDFVFDNDEICYLLARIVDYRGVCRFLYDLEDKSVLEPDFKLHEHSEKYDDENENDKLQLQTDIENAKNSVSILLKYEIIVKNGRKFSLTKEGRESFVNVQYERIEKNAVLSYWRPKKG